MSNILYPNITSLPGSGNAAGVNGGAGGAKKSDAVPGEFDKALQGKMGQEIGKSDAGIASANPAGTADAKDLSQLREPLKFSTHASQRLAERKITLDPSTLQKVNDAINKADAKGVEDTLVLTKDAALIVSVKNRTVITAMDRGSLTGNVFTNIDGAVIV